MVEALFCLLLAVYGGIVSRIHGGGIVDWPKSYNNLLWALPMLAGFLYATPFGLEVSAILSLLCLTAIAGKATGHGNFFDLNTHNGETDKEQLEFIVDWVFPKPSYKRDVFGMLVVGVAAVLGPAIAFAFINPISGLVLLIGGAMKAPAYMFGWSFFNPSKFPTPTNVGEVLTGVFAFYALGVAILMAM